MHTLIAENWSFSPFILHHRKKIQQGSSCAEIAIKLPVQSSIRKGLMLVFIKILGQEGRKLISSWPTEAVFPSAPIPNLHRWEEIVQKLLFPLLLSESVLKYTFQGQSTGRKHKLQTPAEVWLQCAVPVHRRCLLSSEPWQREKGSYWLATGYCRDKEKNLCLGYFTSALKRMYFPTVKRIRILLYHLILAFFSEK